jgi:hypothetical protein
MAAVCNSLLSCVWMQQQPFFSTGAYASHFG